MRPNHIDFLKKAHAWLEYDNKLFVHGGINPQLELKQHSLEFLTWDRTLVENAWFLSRQNLNVKVSSFDEIYVGHTTTQWFIQNKKSNLTPQEVLQLSTQPLFLGNVIMLDTGAGWSGKLTIMDIVTHQYWQSDLTPQLYGIEGRKNY